MIPIANSYFSGGGLMDIGLKQAGIKVQQSLDIDPEATEVMKMNKHFFDHEILTEDISKKLVKPQPDCDVMLKKSTGAFKIKAMLCEAIMIQQNGVSQSVVICDITKSCRITNPGGLVYYSRGILKKC